MGSQRFEVESEAWYRAIAEGRLAPVSDQCAGRIPPPEDPAQRGSGGDWAGYWGAGYSGGYALGTSRSAAVATSS